MKKNIFLILLMLCFSLRGFSQGREGKLPVNYIPFLSEQSTAGSLQTQTYGKAEQGVGIYPLIDWFNNPDPHPADTFWKRGHALRSGRSVVFNAQDSTGQTYSGLFGEADVLHSQLINLYKAGGEAFIQFNYSTGASWSPTDSLVLRLRSGGGTYINLWTSPATVQSGTEVILNILPLNDFLSSQFDIEFVSYSTYSLVKTENFLLNYIVLGHRWNIPFYENFFLYDTAHAAPAPVNWMRSTATVGSQVQTGFGISNTITFDALDEFGLPYRNGNGTYGATDTLMSFPVNLTQFELTDSIYLRFYFKALPNALLTDSLMLEFRNNTGIWTPAMRFNGATTTAYIPVLTQINLGKFRSNHFQFRLIAKCKASALDTLKFAIAGVLIDRKLQLPFIDDFSTSVLIPAVSKWTTRNTHINNSFPVRPPSYNVATFDALDRFGNPYIKLGKYADTLTSAIINLSKLTAQDTGVYITFYIQPKGLGDMPNNGDSLLLEFRTSATQPNLFRPVWTGARSNFSSERFTQIAVKVDSNFFHDDFQFRFKNITGKYGNLNHWHLDYVRLDKSGLKATMNYYDIAVSNAEPSLITPYTAMPYDHFMVNPTGFSRSSQKITLSNNDTVAKPVRYGRNVYDPNGNLIDSISHPTGNVVNGDTTLTIFEAFDLTGALPADSIQFSALYSASTFVNSDNIPFNDTLRVNTVFSNYYAYDDGTAESGYAIMNTTGMVALAYNLAKPDLLYGISMFFNQAVSDVSQRTFDLMVWRNINTNGNGTGEDEIARYSLISPVYTNTINGFYYYKFPTPIALPVGKFYIGWDQNQQFNLNIGIDENFSINGNAVNPNMFYFLDDQGVWAETDLTGGLMMRPLIGKWLNPPTGLASLQLASTFQIEVFPNPASDRIYIQQSNHEIVTADFIDISGRVLMTWSEVDRELTLPDCENGLYFIRFANAQGQVATRKLVLQK